MRSVKIFYPFYLNDGSIDRSLRKFKHISFAEYKTLGAQKSKKLEGSRSLYSRNKIEIQKKNREWKDANPERYRKVQRNYKLKQTYGLSRLQFDDMLSACNNRCEICNDLLNGESKKKIPHIDHNHETGSVRGILCGTCNAGLGHFLDSGEMLKSAILYLDKYDKPIV